MLISNVLKESTLAHDLDDSRLARFVTLARQEEHPPETTLFLEGDSLTDLYVVAEGSVILTMDYKLREQASTLRSVVTIVEAGGTFGWSSVLEPHVAMLSARTRGPCTVVAIDGRKLARLMDDDPVIGYQVMKALAGLVAHRLQATRNSLISERGLELRSTSVPVI